MAVCFGATALIIGCGDRSAIAPRTASYVIVVGAPERGLIVRLELDGVPRAGLTLRACSPSEALEIENFEARGTGGERVRVAASYDTVLQGQARVPIPSFALLGPLPARVVASYRLSGVSREGDAHKGFAGRSLRFLCPEFGFTTGRQLFLIPEPADALQDIRVRFRLPPGWSAVTPWARFQDGWRPGLIGAPAAEH